MPIHIIDTPITGREPLGESGEPVQALAQFYRAFNGRDLALMGENWEPSEAAAMDNPVGGIKRGWPEIRSVYRIFRCVDDRWRQVHHHGSIDDPQLLSAYQEAVGATRQRSKQAGP